MTIESEACFMKLNIKTSALCVVMLLAALLIFTPAPHSSAAAVSGDVYAIDIEFGNLSFYYDYGIWNVNTMRYEASDTSRNNAAGTVDGFPGWYGFDGVANRVSVKNSSPGGSAVTAELTYRSLTADELGGAGVDEIVTGVTMTVTGWPNDKNWVVVPANDTPVIGYIHLQGEPKVNGQRYDSATMAPIGLFTLTITAWD